MSTHETALTAEQRDALLRLGVEQMIKVNDDDGLHALLDKINLNRWTASDVRALVEFLIEHAHPDCLDEMADIAAFSVAGAGAVCIEARS